MYKPSDKDIADFIRESNAIEQYTPESVADMTGLKYEDSPWWISHHNAAFTVLEAAAQGQVLPPEMLHSLLMSRLDDYTDINCSEIGAWRKCNVRVANYTAPKSYVVPRLMEGWQQAVDRWVVGPKGNVSPTERAEICWQFHHWFECIHPFADGNGRSGRLLLNNIRLLSGLDWHTVYASGKADYYAEIEKWRSEKWESIRYHSLEGRARTA